MAASAPPEIIDHILTFVVEEPERLYDPPRGADPTRAMTALRTERKTNMRSMSLVSRSWRLPAQRRLFEQISIKGSAQAQRFIEFALAPCVQDLTLDWGVSTRQATTPTKETCAEQDIMTEDQVVAILSASKRLRTLTLHFPPFASLSRRAQATLAPDSGSFGWPNLVYFSLDTAEFDTEGQLLRTLLNLMPNVVELDLYASCAGTQQNVKRYRAGSPVTLDNLTTLTLSEAFLLEHFADLNVVASSSLARVTTLFCHFWEDANNTNTNTTLHRLSDGILSLTDQIGSDRMSPALCRNLQHLTLYYALSPQTLFDNLPNTISSLTIIAGQNEDFDNDDYWGNLLVSCLNAWPKLPAMQLLRVVLREKFEGPPPSYPAAWKESSNAQAIRLSPLRIVVVDLNTGLELLP